MTTVFSAERISELETVLGAEQRMQLFAALETQAVEARRAIKQHFAAGDEQALRREVHRLKGAAQIVGAGALIAALQRVETDAAGAIPADLLTTIDTEIGGLVAAIDSLRR